MIDPYKQHKKLKLDDVTFTDPFFVEDNADTSSTHSYCTSSTCSNDSQSSFHYSSSRLSSPSSSQINDSDTLFDVNDDPEFPDAFDADIEFDFEHKETYLGSSITLINSLAILFSWFSAYPGISKEAFGRLLYILHNFILPASNNLPSTYATAHHLVKPFLLQPQEYHCCSNDCILFRNEYQDLTQCPHCDNDRYYNGTSQPVKKFKYLPILPCIRRMFSIPKLSKLIQQHMSATSEQSIIDDIHLSNAWKTLYSENGAFHGDARSLAFALCTDGMNPFSKEKTSYSMWPVTLSLLNLPSDIRTKSTSLFLVGIIPGPKEPKNMNPYLEVLIDELLDLPNHTIYDSHRKETFAPHANIVLHILDYPGQNKVFKCTGEP